MTPTCRTATVLLSLLFLLSCVVLVSRCQTFDIRTLVGYQFNNGEGGLATQVSVNKPKGVAFHPVTGDLFIADTENQVIRKVDKINGEISTVAGIQGSRGFSGDGGPATQAKFWDPSQLPSVNPCLFPIITIIV